MGLENFRGDREFVVYGVMRLLWRGRGDCVAQVEADQSGGKQLRMLERELGR